MRINDIFSFFVAYYYFFLKLHSLVAVSTLTQVSKLRPLLPSCVYSSPRHPSVIRPAPPSQVTGNRASLEAKYKNLQRSTSVRCRLALEFIHVIISLAILLFSAFNPFFTIVDAFINAKSISQQSVH